MPGTAITIIADTTDAADAAVIRPRPGAAGWMMMMPLFLWLAAFVVAPNVIMAVYSFSEYTGPASVNFRFSFDNYARIFDRTILGVFGTAMLWAAGGGVVATTVGFGLARLQGRRSVGSAFRSGFWGFLLVASVALHFGIFALPLGVGTWVKILWRSVEYAATTTVLCLVIGYPVAYFIGRANVKWRNRLLMLVMIPFWTSFLIRTYAWINILSEQGLLNGFLQYTHLIGAPLDLFYNPFSVTVGLVYNYVPFMILPIYASVEKLDNALVEAALDLGAGPVRAFSQVIIPLTRPGIVAGILLVFIPAIGMFAVVDLMSGSKIKTVGTAIQDQFIGQAGNWPFGSALGVTVLVIFAAAFFVFGRKGSV